MLPNKVGLRRREGIKSLTRRPLLSGRKQPFSHQDFGAAFGDEGVEAGRFGEAVAGVEAVGAGVEIGDGNPEIAISGCPRLVLNPGQQMRADAAALEWRGDRQHVDVGPAHPVKADGEGGGEYPAETGGKARRGRVFEGKKGRQLGGGGGVAEPGVDGGAERAEVCGFIWGHCGEGEATGKDVRGGAERRDGGVAYHGHHPEGCGGGVRWGLRGWGVAEAEGATVVAHGSVSPEAPVLVVERPVRALANRPRGWS